MLGRRVLRQHEREHLDLVELVDAEDAAGVAARRRPPRGGSRWRCPRSAAAGPRRDDLVAVEAGERHLRRAHQVEVVLGGLVDRGPVGREEPGAVHRLLAHQHRRHDRREARRPRGAPARAPPARTATARAAPAGTRSGRPTPAPPPPCRARPPPRPAPRGRARRTRRRAGRPPCGPRRRRPRRPSGASSSARFGSAAAARRARSSAARSSPLQGAERLAQAPGLGLLGGRVATLLAGRADGLRDAGPLRPRLLDPRPQGARALVGVEQAAPARRRPRGARGWPPPAPSRSGSA